MKFDIRIPVITIRILLIAFTVLFISIGGLLPFSFISFNYFYNYMIPLPTIRLPLSNYILNYDFRTLPPFVIIGDELGPIYGNQPHPTQKSPFDSFLFYLNYDFELVFKPYCQNSRNDYEPLMYKTSIISNHLLNQLSPYGTKTYVGKRFYVWPVTNNIHQLQNPHVLVSSMNSMMLKCGEQDRKALHKVETLVPPVFKWFIPSVLLDFEYRKDDTRHRVDLFKDVNFDNYLSEEKKDLFSMDQFNIVLEFNRPEVIIDPSESEIVITASWKGIRFYLFRYKILSYLIGTTILWLTSSSVLILTVGSLILVRELRSQAQEIVDQDENEMLDDDETIAYKERPVALNTDETGGFYGRDEDNGIDFRVDVRETDIPIERSSQLGSEEASTT